MERGPSQEVSVENIRKCMYHSDGTLLHWIMHVVTWVHVCVVQEQDWWSLKMMYKLVDMKMYKWCGKCYRKLKLKLLTTTISASNCLSGESLYAPTPTILKLRRNLQIRLKTKHKFNTLQIKLVLSYGSTRASSWLLASLQLLY